MFKKVILLLPVVALCCLGSGSMAGAEPGFQVVISADNPTESISAKNLSKLFFKKTVKWDNGKEALPVDLSADSPARELFSTGVHGRDVSAVKNFWQKQIFSGRSVPPPELASDKEVLEYVGAHPGAIGYISAGTKDIPAGVKIVAITGYAD